ADAAKVGTRARPGDRRRGIVVGERRAVLIVAAARLGDGAPELRLALRGREGGAIRRRGVDAFEFPLLATHERPHLALGELARRFQNGALAAHRLRVGATRAQPERDADGDEASATTEGATTPHGDLPRPYMRRCSV